MRQFELYAIITLTYSSHVRYSGRLCTCDSTKVHFLLNDVHTCRTYQDVKEEGAKCLGSLGFVLGAEAYR